MKNSEKNNHYSPWVSLAITGNDVDPELITSLLRIKPHRSHKQHEKKKDGVREWSIGAWVLSSEGQVDTMDLASHINWLVDQLVPVKNELIEISKKKDIKIQMLVFWIMPSTHEVFTLSSDLLKRVVELKIGVDFSIYAPDD